MTANNSCVSHVLLTGLPGVGKTTLVCKISDILKEKHVSTFGFYTKEKLNSANSRIGFDVVTLDGNTGRLARSIDILKSNEISKHKVGKYSVLINEFETLALPSLTKCISATAPTVVIIDEIGKMELFSKAFSDIVSKLFANKNIKILATIPVSRGKPIHLIEELRKDPNSIVITVDRSNRNYVTEEILYNLQITNK